MFTPTLNPITLLQIIFISLLLSSVPATAQTQQPRLLETTNVALGPSIVEEANPSSSAPTYLQKETLELN
jgi:hypothetical protein